MSASNSYLNDNDSESQMRNGPHNINFTSELCQFLSSLAKTPEEQYQELNLNLSRLKEALLQEVETESETSRSKRSSESSNDNNDSSDSSSSPSSPRQRSDTESSSPSSDVSSSASRSRDSNYGSLRNQNRFNNYGRRVYFALQKGARYELVEKQIETVFTAFGAVKCARIYNRPKKGIDGYIEFLCANSASASLNRTVVMGQCHILTLKDWSELTETPEPKQILLESRYLPHVYEKEMVLRSFFNKFGCVQGVVFLGYKGGDLQRFVIIFRDNEPALDLIGSSVKILSSTVFIKEVTDKTVHE